MTSDTGERAIEKPAFIGGRLDVLRACLPALRDVGSETELYDRLCEVIVASRNYEVAWFGRAQEDGTVRILAASGPAAAYAQGLDVRWDGGPLAVGPTGRSIGTNVPQLVDVEDPAFAPWRSRAQPYGIRNCLSVPFRFPDDAMGCLAVYSSREYAALLYDMPLLELLVGMLGMRGALSEKETQAQRRYKRLESLWAFSFMPGLDDTNRLRAILEEGSRALGAERDFFGVLSHIEEDELVFDALTSEAERMHVGEVWRVIVPGDRLPLAGMLQQLFHQQGRTSAWSDLRIAPASPATASALDMGWRSAIGTTFEVAGKQYVLMFASSNPPPRPFDHEDYSYVELIANFFARELYEQWRESEIRYQAEHDVLTGLINRTAFHNYFERSLERARRLNGRCALIMLDLDHFKEVNDTLGHQAGDAVLRETAERLRSALRGEEIISRLGGDEFAIVIREAPTEEVVEAIAERIEQTFTGTYSIENNEVRLTSSLGIAQFPIDGESVDLLLAHADAAMYQAKDLGRNRHQFFNESIQAQLIERRALLDAIHHALANGEFVLHYHPEIDTRTGEVVGAEALIRWPRKPGEPIVPPSALIAFAQDAGLMQSISRWVFRRAIEEYPKLTSGKRPFRLFFNLSSMEVGDPEFIEELRREYDAARARGLLLGVEVTEAAALHHPDRALETLTMLRNNGFEIALDDFGTGYSSLSMLKTLPIDILKIDRSFINGITTDRNDAAIVRTIISFAQLLGRRTLAEGVETDEQAELLRAYGCHYAQGFLLARPMLPEDFRRWCDERELRRESRGGALDAP